MSQRILVVDDSWLMRLFIKKALTRAGLEVVGEAKNGQEAVELYTRLKPDLVTMDLNMPELDGFEAIRKIRELDPQAKILVVTALGHDLLEKDIVKMGIKAMMVKPFQTKDLISTVKGLL